MLPLQATLAGAAMDAGMELASQLIDNGGNIDCLDWADIGASGVNGGMSGGLTGPLGKAFTAVKGLRKVARGGERVRRLLVDGKLTASSLKGSRQSLGGSQNLSSLILQLGKPSFRMPCPPQRASDRAETKHTEWASEWQAADAEV
jgi:hypothetical protein